MTSIRHIALFVSDLLTPSSFVTVTRLRGESRYPAMSSALPESLPAAGSNFE
jgi:hypothetical protein